MKLVLQIAFGVYLGMTAAQFTIDTWHKRQEEAARSVAAKAKQERDAKIEALFKRARQSQDTAPGSPPPGYVPDDAPDAGQPQN